MKGKSLYYTFTIVDVLKAFVVCGIVDYLQNCLKWVKYILQGLEQGGILYPIFYVCFIFYFINLLVSIKCGFSMNSRKMGASSADDELLKMAVSEIEMLTNYFESALNLFL